MPWGKIDDDLKLPSRISIGTLGAEIALETNFFPIVVENSCNKMVHYEVILKKQKGQGKEVMLPRRAKMEIFEKLKHTYPMVFKDHALAFDSERNAYSVGIIPGLSGDHYFEVEHESPTGNKDRFTLNFQVRSHADIQELLKALSATTNIRKPLPASSFQMLEVMFRHYRSLKYELVGRRSFYSVSGDFGEPYPISQGKEGVVGFFGSMRPAAWKDGSLLLNIDVSHTAFYKEQSLMHFVMGILDLQPRDCERPFDPHKRVKLARELNGIQVQSTHTNINRMYRIIEVSPHGSNRQQVPHKDSDTGLTSHISVEKYLRDIYGRKLKYPNLNCIRLAPLDRNVYLPIEFLRLTKGQRVNKKLNDRETAQFIRTTAVPPADRKKQICHIHRNNEFTKDPMLKDLQFTISDLPLNIAGRVLPTPKLLMDQPVVPTGGVWEARRRKFFCGGSVKTWVIFNYAVRHVTSAQIRSFVGTLMDMGRERGMNFQDPVGLIERPRPNPEQDFKNVKFQHKDLTLIMVVLGKGDDLYARIKQVGDMEIGVLTQCVQANNVRNCKPPTLSNLILKINAKLDGINCVLAHENRILVLDRPVMIMGADVNHPPAGDSGSPSMAAVVSSLDRHASRYVTEVKPQEHRVEIIKDLKNMTRNLLLAFFIENKKVKPERLIMFRDGVSESQFQEVLAYELMAMREACKSLQPGYEPGITFLVVQKRHHTRFFCSERDGVGKCLNVPPGTVVDSSITHPKERDFYLCSHQGIQGTSKPTHYHVLWDDNDFSMDELQNLTYSMCHLYNRCTRSVSLPSAAYYAHLAAYRAKVHITDSDHDAEKLSSEEMKQASTVSANNPISKKFYYV